MEPEDAATFPALLLRQDDGEVTASVEDIRGDQLPEGDVLIEVGYSSLNYKDALAVTGQGKVVRGRYPFVPGIDLVGKVKASSVPAYRTGDPVIVTGWGIGEERWGGYARRQRVRSEWIVPLPEELSMKEAMVIGTAGLTAMLAVMALEEHGASQDDGEVLVSGASGGVGSFAVVLLDRLGYEVAASTGKADAASYLRQLGASRIVERGELDRRPERPLESARWAGAVDTVGGDTLASLLSETKRHGSIAAVGNAGGHELHTTVYPFILRGVNLLGIDSNTCPQARRQASWHRLARLLQKEQLSSILKETIALDRLPEVSRQMVRGSGQGRVVVDVQR